MVALIILSILGIDFMNEPNIYNPANPKTPCAFNSDAGSASDTAHIITRDEQLASFDRIDALIQATKESIANG
jgi:hypothetical protein